LNTKTLSEIILWNIIADKPPNPDDNELSHGQSLYKESEELVGLHSLDVIVFCFTAEKKGFAL